MEKMDWGRSNVSDDTVHQGGTRSVYGDVVRQVAAISIPLRVFVVSRLGLFLLVYLSMVFIPRSSPFPWQAFPENKFLDGWFRSDAGWYGHIAEDGYDNEPKNEFGQRDTVFFPLYPLAVRALLPITGNVFLAAFLVSNLAFLAALVLFFRLVEDEFGAGIANRSITLLVVYPFSFYYSAMYTEALFLLAAVWAFYFGRRRRWILASLGVAAAGATRLVGVLAGVGLLLMYLEHIEFNWRRIRPNILWLGIGLLGPLSYMLFLGLKFGNPLQFWHSQWVPGWGGNSGLDDLWATLGAALAPGAIVKGHYPGMSIIHLVFFVLAIGMSLLVWRRTNKAYGAWAFLTVIASFSLWRSMGRYVAPVFPLYIVASQLLSEQWFRTVVYVSTLLLALFAIMHALFLWVS